MSSTITHDGNKLRLLNMITKRIIHIITLWTAICLCFGICIRDVQAQTQAVDGIQTSLVKDARVTVPPDDMFVDIQVSNHQIYLGEILKVEYDVYVASKLGQVYYDVEDPDFAKWDSIEGITQPPTPASFLGKSYAREPFAIYFVSPTIPGKLALPQLKVQIPYLKSKPWITHEPRYIEVLPLPEPQPAGFYRGNVGQFTIEVEHSETHIRVGDIITFNLRITGNTPRSTIQLAPYQLKDDPNAFWIYPPINEGNSKSIIKEQLYTSQKLRYRVLALEEGEWTLPPFTLVSFNPKTHQYKKQSTDSFQVYVEPSKQLEPVIKLKAKPLLVYQQPVSEIHLQKPEKLDISFNWLFLPLSFLILVLLATIGYSHKEKLYKEIEKHRRTEKLLDLIGSAETAEIQLDSIKELFELRFNINIFQPNAQTALLDFFNEEGAALIISVVQEIRLASYSTHQPIHNEQMDEILELLRSSK